TPPGLFRSLPYQLVKVAPDANLQLLKKFEDRREQTQHTEDENWKWHDGEVHDFKSALPEVLKAQSVYLFVDALNECGENLWLSWSNGFEQLIKQLPLNMSPFKICLSRRRCPALKPDYGWEIRMEHANSVGVVKYVNTPPDLDGLYVEGLRGLEAKNASRKLIQCKCFSKRPMSVAELRWAMAIDVDNDTGHPSLSRFRQSEEFVADDEIMERRIKSLIRGLAGMVTSVSSGSTVQFIHQSVQGFFTNKGLAILGGSDSSQPPTNLEIAGAHHNLLKAFIRYLSVDEIQQGQSGPVLTFAFLLLQYANESWDFYARQSEANGTRREDLFLEFEWSLRQDFILETRLYISVISSNGPQLCTC
ncbi:hypothetical protein EDB81DRAFT_634478, partial [Dactylonectria macrodidyma]